MIIQPKVRGFICTTAHPKGCAKNVQEQIDYVQRQPRAKGPKKVLVIGASTGYGLASRIVASFSAMAQTIGVFFERPAMEKRTASAGWYNTVAFEQAAATAGIYAKSINGDAFSDTLKQQVANLVRQDWGGGVDLVIYSLASPKRQHPRTGQVFSSVLKPIGKRFNDKTVDIMTGKVGDIDIEPANEQEVLDTVAVMGGEDWQLWIEALLSQDLLAKGAVTLAYSYIGPELTYPIYRQGTIGAAKADLEKTAHQLNALMQTQCQGHAYVSVNKALVTQASAAIPVVPLYMSLLYRVMKDKKCHEGCIEQIQRLFAERLYHDGEVPLDDQHRIRMDDWEMREDIQAQVASLWQHVNTENISQLADLEGYRHAFYQLFGFEFPEIDYDQDIEASVNIPSLLETLESVDKP